MLNVFAPIEEYKGNNLLDIKNPSIEIRGYINEVKDLNHFESMYTLHIPNSTKSTSEALTRSIIDVKILDISFYDENGNKLNPIDGWIPLHKKTKIVVTYSGRADQIDYIFTPTGTETYNLQKIIGNSFVSPNDTKAEFIWTPSAEQTLGYINISIHQGNYSVRSELINVMYQ
jgi:hypothetical protein